MSSKKPSIPSGFRDFGPQVMQGRKFIMQQIENAFLRFGFQAIETPSIENLNTLLGKYGTEGDQLIFKILNNGDFLAKVDDKTLQLRNSNDLLPTISEKGLRYDLTVPMARFVSMNRHALPMPFKRYQMQPVWRADRPQKGRYREFWQCDADIVGTTSIYTDIELLHLYDMAFANLKLPVIIRFNHRQIFNSLLASLTTENQLRFMQLIDKFDKIGNEVSTLLQNEIGAAAVSIWNLITQANELTNNQEKFNFLKSKNTFSPELIDEMDTLLSFCENSTNNIQLDFTLARGLSYYTGTIYEVIPSPAALPAGFNIGSIGGGGRYDNLTSLFGFNEGGQGVGISFGLDRIYDCMEAANLLNFNQSKEIHVLICAMDSINLTSAYSPCQQLRNAQINSELYPAATKLRKMLDFANLKNCSHAIILGQNEIESQIASVKDLQTGNQTQIPFNKLSSHFNEIR